jgi:hypothetical protein
MASAEAMALLKRIDMANPDPLTTSADEEEAACELRDAGMIELWDMWPDGRQRWYATALGREILSRP